MRDFEVVQSTASKHGMGWITPRRELMDMPRFKTFAGALILMICATSSNRDSGNPDSAQSLLHRA